MRERETRGYKPFDIHAPIHWAMVVVCDCRRGGDQLGSSQGRDLVIVEDSDECACPCTTRDRRAPRIVQLHLELFEGTKFRVQGSRFRVIRAGLKV